MEIYLLDNFLSCHLSKLHFPELRNVQQTLFLYVNKQFLEYLQEPSSMVKITVTLFILSQSCLNYFSIIISIKSCRCVNKTPALASSEEIVLTGPHSLYADLLTLIFLAPCILQDILQMRFQLFFARQRLSIHVPSLNRPQ